MTSQNLFHIILWSVLTRIFIFNIHFNRSFLIFLCVLQKSLLVARYFPHFAGIQLDCCILHSTEKKKGLWIFSVMDGWMSAGIDEWLDGWMVGCKSIKLPNGIPHIMQCGGYG